MAGQPVTNDELQQFNERHRRLVAYLQRVLGRRDLAEEVAQEAYLQAHRYGPKPCPDCWLFAVARRGAIDRLRRARVRTQPNNDLDGEQSTPSELERCLYRWDLSKIHRKLVQMINQLQPTLRDVIRLRHLDGMSRAEVAAKLGISVGAVEQRTTRAHCQLRERLLATFGEPFR